jgi:hypothetical protein
VDYSFEVQEKKPNSRKVVLVFVIVAIVVGVVIVGSILLSNSGNNNESGYRIVALPNFVTESPSDFAQSRLNLYTNGTFDVEIIFFNQSDQRAIKRFMGMGTYTRDGNRYVFTYTDAHTLSGGILEHDAEFIKETQEYTIEGSRILFRLHGRTYTFGR